MKKLLKIFFNISYVVSLSALVFLGGVINKFAGSGSQHERDGQTVLGNSLTLNSALADVPAGGGGDSVGGGDSGCEGGEGSGSGDSGGC